MFQGNSFQGNAYQAGPPAPETITVDKWTPTFPDRTTKTVLGVALATSIGCVWMPPVEQPRAEAVSQQVVYDRIVPYQAQAFVRLVETPLPQALGPMPSLVQGTPFHSRPAFVPIVQSSEVVTCDKWTGYSVFPKRPAPRSQALDSVSSGLAWVPQIDTPFPEALAPVIAYDSPFFYQAAAWSTFTPTSGETVTLDKWLNYSVMPIRLAARPQADPAFVAPLFDGGFAPRLSWGTDSPFPAPAAARPRDRDPRFVAPLFDGDFAPRLSWGTDSPFPAPPALRPRDRDPRLVEPLFDGDFAPRLSWGTDSPPVPPLKARKGSDAFVDPPYDGDFAPRLSWGTDSPMPAPARKPARDDVIAFLYPIAAAAEVVTLDKWLGYPSFTPTPAPRPASLFLFDPFPLPNTGETITVDKWLGYSTDPLRRIVRPESGAATLVFWDVVFPDKWLAMGTLGPQLRKPIPQQSPAAEPAYVVEVVAPLAWGTDSPQQTPSLRAASLVRSLGAFSWSNSTITNADTAPPGTATLTASINPRLQGYQSQYTRIDTFSRFSTPDEQPPPNPAPTDLFTVSGEQVIDRFPFFGVSSPWDVKRRTQ